MVVCNFEIIQQLCDRLGDVLLNRSMVRVR